LEEEFTQRRGGRGGRRGKREEFTRRRGDAEDAEEEGRIKERELEKIADCIEGELKEKATCANFAHAAVDGKNYN
jgi:hypothetical protein